MSNEKPKVAYLGFDFNIIRARRRYLVFNILFIIVGIFTILIDGNDLVANEVVGILEVIGGLVGLAGTLGFFHRQIDYIGVVISTAILVRPISILTTVLTDDTIDVEYALSLVLINLLFWMAFRTVWLTTTRVIMENTPYRFAEIVKGRLKRNGT